MVRNGVLDTLYLTILQKGLLFSREAHSQRLCDWLGAEIEFLHNIPSLMGDTNLHRHVYFVQGEWDLYMQTMREKCPDMLTYTEAYYGPVLKELRAIIDGASQIDD
jgi:hypothetical protein